VLEVTTTTATMMTTTATMMTTTTTLPMPPSQQLSQAITIYGGLFVVTLVLYMLIRNRFKLTYSPRSVVPRLFTELASREYGPLGWIIGALRVTDEEMYQVAGLDAVAFVRWLEMGCKIALLGCVNALYLIPAYSSGPGNPYVVDELDKWALGNVPTGNSRIWAAVPASYIVFLYALYLVHAEFRWYIAKRHQYLSRALAENYTVALGGIPQELRSSKALTVYFERMFPAKVVEARVMLDVRDLEKKVTAREALVPQLEHVANVFTASGQRPEHRQKLFIGAMVDSIKQHQEELRDLNEHISTSISRLEELQREHESHTPPQPEGLYRSAGFVSFSSLYATQSVLQMLQMERPSKLFSRPTCQPGCIDWNNVGLAPKRKQCGELLSMVLTVLICIFWTIPVAFISSLSKVENLQRALPFLNGMIENASWISGALALLQPLLLSLLVTLQPTILGLFVSLEGHVSLAEAQASLFSKLTLFMIVQIFFISAISGSLFATLDELIMEPFSTIQDMLGSGLPGQATTFIVFVITRTFLGSCMELLRVVPVATAFIRRQFGPTLTEKERNSVWLGLRPLTDPGPLLSQELLRSNVVLMFMIMMVYVILSPITSFVMALAFFVMVVTYRNQFVHVYDSTVGEAGGLFWPSAMRYVLTCMVVALLTDIAVLALKQGKYQAPFMLPLLVIVAVFWLYLEHEHMRATRWLPAAECVRVDEMRSEEAQSFEFLRGAFVQHALRTKVLEAELPESLNGEESNGAEHASEQTPALPGQAPEQAVKVSA